jgi:hypothetical protein
MPFDGGERHKLAETPPRHHDCRKKPMPQSCHRVPDFLPVQVPQVGLLFFAEVVVTSFAGITNAANLGAQRIEPITGHCG